MDRNKRDRQPPPIKSRIMPGVVKPGAVTVNKGAYDNLTRWVAGGQADYWTMVDIRDRIKAGLTYLPDQTGRDDAGDYSSQILVLLENAIAAVKNPPPKPASPPAAPPATNGIPHGIPGDRDAFLAFLKAGVFTPEQQRYLLQALPYYREPVLATQDPKGLEILAVWTEVAKTLPPLPVFESTFKVPGK